MFPSYALDYAYVLPFSTFLPSYIYFTTSLTTPLTHLACPHSYFPPVTYDVLLLSTCMPSFVPFLVLPFNYEAFSLPFPPPMSRQDRWSTFHTSSLRCRAGPLNTLWGRAWCLPALFLRVERCQETRDRLRSEGRREESVRD